MRDLCARVICDTSIYNCSDGVSGNSNAPWDQGKLVVIKTRTIVCLL